MINLHIVQILFIRYEKDCSSERIGLQKVTSDVRGLGVFCHQSLNTPSISDELNRENHSPKTNAFVTFNFRIKVPSREGFIRHFRNFRVTKQKNSTFYMNKVKRVKDTSLAEWSMRIKDSVHDVREKLFGSKKIKV